MREDEDEHDIRASEIDWVFCWRTSTGEVRSGSRDMGMNSRPAPYDPDAFGSDRGVRTIVRGGVRTCPLPPIGPRVDQQGAISLLGMKIGGYVTRASLIPARTERELDTLRKAASAMVVAGSASEWALAAIRAQGRDCWALHVGAPPAIVAELARSIDAPWTLDVQESRIVCLGRKASVIATLEVDAVFDDAPIPVFAMDWRSASDGGRPLEGRGGGHVIAVPCERPTGPDAWERWVKAEDRQSRRQRLSRKV